MVIAEVITEAEVDDDRDEDVNPDKNSSVIKVLIRMPDTWNRRMFMGGSGGLAGDLYDESSMAGIMAAGVTALERGFTTVTTDTGHNNVVEPFGYVFDYVDWAIDSPPSAGIDNEAELNYAYRGVHFAAISAKDVIHAFYKKFPKYSYFSGCSNGGRQAVMEAVRYPEDFDGIIAGAPAISYTKSFTRAGFNSKVNLLVIGQLNEDKLEIVSNTVLALCDANDGIVDGILNDPRQCEFKPSMHLNLCVDDVNADDCFTSQQVDALEAIYGTIKLKHPEVTLPGFSVSSEAGDYSTTEFSHGWPSWITGITELGGFNLDFGFGVAINKGFLFDNLDYSEEDHANYLINQSPQDIYADQQTAWSGGADVPGSDLSAFRERGGKLIIYQGWIDPAISPQSVIDAYYDIRKYTGDRHDGYYRDDRDDRDDRDGRHGTEKFARLFMMPGVAHCAYGPGPQITDGFATIMDWVEKGNAPDALIATDLSLTTTRPVCAYPMVAKVIDPEGDTNSPENFKCVAGPNLKEFGGR